jgi:hypothetical protein
MAQRRQPMVEPPGESPAGLLDCTHFRPSRVSSARRTGRCVRLGRLETGGDLGRAGYAILSR